MEVFGLSLAAVAGIFAINQPQLNNVYSVYGYYLLVLLALPLYIAHVRGGIAKRFGISYGRAKGALYIVLMLLSVSAAVLFVSRSSVVAAVFAFGVAPICEEVFFRGYIVSSLEGRGRWYTVVFSAIMFDVAHAEVSSGFEPYLIRFAYGALFALLFLNSGRILVPISFHMIVNEYTVFATVKPLGFNEEVLLLTTGALLLSLAFFDYYTSSKGGPRMPRQDRDDLPENHSNSG